MTTTAANEELTAEETDEILAGELTDRDVQMLDFEQSWFKYAGAKEAAIRDRFDMTATRYYQVLNVLLDKPAAMAYDAMTVKRLQRLRSARRRERAAGRVHAGSAGSGQHP